MERNNRCLTWVEVYTQINKMIDKLDSGLKLYGIPRGGQVVLGIIGFYKF